MSLHWLADAPIDISTDTTGSWVDTDVSSYVPSSATGVIVRMREKSGTDNSIFQTRVNGSTDTFASNSFIVGSTHSWFIVGLDSNRIFEQKTNSTAVDLYLWGYVESDFVPFTNAVDVSTTTTGSYVDVDITPYTGSNTATAAVCTAVPGSVTNTQFYARKNGSTDDRYTSTDDTSHFFIVGVDGDQIFEQKISGTSRDLYLQGYFRSGITMATNGTNVSLGSTGTWTDLTAVTSAAGIIYEMDETTTESSCGFRKNGTTFNTISTVLGNASARTLYQAIVEPDTSGVVEGIVSALTTDFYQVGTFSAGRKFLIT